MSAERLTVAFEPAGLRVEVAPGSTVLDAARAGAIGLASVCGGEGTCGRCRVEVLYGALPEPAPAEWRTLSRSEIAAGQRLACRIPVAGDMTIRVPRASLVGGQRLQVEGPADKAVVDAAVRALRVRARPPTLHDQRSDLERIAAAASTAGLRGLRADPPAVARLATVARDADWDVTLLLRGRDLVGVTTGDRHPVGLAVDLGTTKIAGYLVDLVTGAQLAAGGVLNPQIGFGEDVVSRLAFAARSADGAAELARVVRAAMDELAGSLCELAGVTRDEVADACVVANTAMHHLLLGLPTRGLAAAPFVAAASAPMDPRARDLGLAIAPDARVHVLPNIGGFVGADHVAMILGADLDRVDAVKVGVDIGTNTEIVLRRPDADHLTSASCASGPAFEGAHIRDGMRAGTGAIEAVRLPDGAGDPWVRTIDGTPAVGICGSGIVDAVAELWRTGRINHRGRLRADAPGVRAGDSGLEVVLVPAAESGTGRDIAITQGDVNEIQLAKGAIAAGVVALLEATATDPASVEEVVVAGAFGTYLDLDSALGIGLLPRLPNAAYVQIGNAAGTGARAALVSLRERARARAIARGTRYLELTTWPGFQTTFAHAMQFQPPDPRGR